MSTQDHQSRLIRRLRTENGALRSVIADMVPLIEAEKRHLLESYCHLDDALEPIPETLDDPLAIELIESYDALIARGQAVLSRVRP